MSHTPGPWWVTDHGVRDRGGYICETKKANRYQGQDERYANEAAERAANALLIAAAPELLDVLVALQSAGGIWPDLLPRVNDAVAKATGAPATPAPEPVQVEQYCPGNLPQCKWVPMQPIGSRCTTCGDEIPF